MSSTSAPARRPSLRHALAQSTSWITAAALQHPAELPGQLMQRLAISRRSANNLLKRLVDGQWLQRGGTPRRPLYTPGGLRQVVQRYPLAGLQEDLPWRRDFSPFFELPPAVRRMAQHAFTELLNNAVDHSGGQAVTVSMRQTPLHLQLLVSDDGCGLFQRLDQVFGLGDPQLAMFELSKGKLTTQPERHSGHGLYFSSRLADVFDLHANQVAFQYRGASQGRQRWHDTRAVGRGGTSIYLAIALDTERTLDGVLRQHSLDGQGYGFERTQVALQLLGGRGQALASRADARRVAARLQQFGCAEIDFSGIGEVGHGFADELFRVIPAAQPQLRLQALAMDSRVAAMVASVQAA